MKQVFYSLLLVALLVSCKKEKSGPAPPLSMSAVINGQPWEATAGMFLAVAQIDRASQGNISQHVVSIRGGSEAFLPLGFKTLDITLGANYRPKVGRHPINYGLGGFIGSPNPNYRQLQGGITFQLPNSQIYQAQASSGFVEITAVTDTQVTGTFDLTANTFQPSNGAPSVLQVQNGKFCAKIIGSATNTNVPWDEEQ